MTVEELICQVRAIAEKADLVIGNTRWYLFGSALLDPVRAADIDLLVICQNCLDVGIVRETVSQFDIRKPIDLSILTVDEEAETSFVANQRCIQVFPACR